MSITKKSRFNQNKCHQQHILSSFMWCNPFCCISNIFWENSILLNLYMIFYATTHDPCCAWVSGLVIAWHLMIVPLTGDLQLTLSKYWVSIDYWFSIAWILFKAFCCGWPWTGINIHSKKKRCYFNTKSVILTPK